MNRALIKKKELIMILLLLTAALAVWYSFTLFPKGSRVTVEQNGAVVYQRGLAEIEAPIRLEVTGESGKAVYIQLDQSGAAIVESSCADQTCVHTGKITRAGETTICLPERVSVTIKGDTVDAMTY